MRSNMFANIENKFEFASKEVIEATAIQSLAELVEELRETFNAESIFGLMVIIARLGVAGDGILNQEEKDLIDKVFGRVYKGPMDEIYNVIGTTIPDSDYEMVGILARMGNHVAMPLLHCILSFAYIDQVMEDHVAEKLDPLFCMNLMMEFFNSDLEEVPHPIIRLTGLEAEIVEWFKSDDQLRPLADIQKCFPGKSRAELKRVLDGLCQKGILYGGDNFIGCMYGLDSADVEYVVTPAPANSTTNRKQDKAESKQERAREKKPERDCKERTITGKMGTQNAPLKANVLTNLETQKQGLPSRTQQEIDQDSAIKTYVEAYGQWKAEVQKVEADRETQIRKQLSEMEKTLKLKAEKDLKDRLNQNNVLRKELRRKRNEAEKTLSTLGFFKFSEKSRNKQIIEDTQTRLVQLDREDAELKEDHQKRLSGIQTEVEKQTSNIRLQIEKEYPLPVLPQKPENMIPSKGYMEELILNHMEYGVDYTVSDLIAQIPELSEAGISKVRPALTPLMDRGVVERSEMNGRAIFRLVHNRSEQSQFVAPPQMKNAAYDKEAMAKLIQNHMKYGVEYTVTDLIAQIPELSGMGIVQVRPALTPLMDRGVVRRLERNGRAVFSLK